MTVVLRLIDAPTKVKLGPLPAIVCDSDNVYFGSTGWTYCSAAAENIETVINDYCLRRTVNYRLLTCSELCDKYQLNIHYSIAPLVFCIMTPYITVYMCTGERGFDCCIDIIIQQSKHIKYVKYFTYSKIMYYGEEIRTSHTAGEFIHDVVNIMVNPSAVCAFKKYGFCI